MIVPSVTIVAALIERVAHFQDFILCFRRKVSFCLTAFEGTTVFEILVGTINIHRSGAGCQVVFIADSLSVTVFNYRRNIVVGYCSGERIVGQMTVEIKIRWGSCCRK